MVWVDEEWHNLAIRRLLVENSRSVSLTDCLSFEIIEKRNIACAFAFDNHFADRWFELADFRPH